MMITRITLREEAAAVVRQHDLSHRHLHVPMEKVLARLRITLLFEA